MMKSKLLNSLILTALAVPGVAMAADAPPVTGNVSLVSDYLYRGISQTAGKPAIQGGFDYAHPSGFYAGAWGSSISWLSDAGASTGSGMELDTYLGFKNGFATDFSYDVGFLRYNYDAVFNNDANSPTGSGFPSADTNEIYGLIGWKWITAKYSYATSNLFGFTDSSGSGYFDLSASYSPEDFYGIAFGAHVGRQTIKHSSFANYKAGRRSNIQVLQITTIGS